MPRAREKKRINTFFKLRENAARKEIAAIARLTGARGSGCEILFHAVTSR